MNEKMVSYDKKQAVKRICFLYKIFIIQEFVLQLYDIKTLLVIIYV